MKVKVCGMKYAENISAIADNGPDFMGFIFYDSSPRNVGREFDVRLLEGIGQEINRVGVFVDEDIDVVVEICRKYSLDYVQLHGDESVDYCTSIKENDIQIIKAFRIHDGFDFGIFGMYESSVDLFLCDTHGEGRGGTGRKFDWALLNNYTGSLPFLLSGGILSQDIEAILQIEHPQLLGVDINSQFEIAPGMKNEQLVSDFMQKIRT